MSRLFGGAIGLAVLSTLAAGAAHAGFGVSNAQALTNGFGVAFRVGALLCLAGAAVAVLQLRGPATMAVTPEPEIEESEALAA
jgi:hypothetical protein